MQKAPLKHHPQYYLEDGNITFLVENDLFRVHRYFFVRESVVFRDMLSSPSEPQTGVEGLSDDKPIVLPDVTSTDFASMLWMFYNDRYADYTASPETWFSIMALAHRWQFETMLERAFDEYAALPGVSSVDKIAIGQKYEFPRKVLLNWYKDICTRFHPLSVEEGEKVGLQTLARIALTREELKSRPDILLTSIVTNNLIELEPSTYYG